jgi:hypothetical protein
MEDWVVPVLCALCGSQEAWTGNWCTVFLELWHAGGSIPCMREGCTGHLVPRHVACTCGQESHHGLPTPLQARQGRGAPGQGGRWARSSGDNGI